MTEPSGIEQAIAVAGDRSTFAHHLGVSVQAVSQWVQRGWVPLARALEIEELYAVPRVRLLKPELRMLAEPLPEE